MGLQGVRQPGSSNKIRIYREMLYLGNNTHQAIKLEFIGECPSVGNITFLEEWPMQESKIRIYRHILYHGGNGKILEGVPSRR